MNYDDGNHLGNKKVTLWQVFLLLTFGSCDMDSNIRSLLAGYISNVATRFSDFWG